MEYRAADGRVALDLPPVGGLVVELGGDRQVAQVEIGTDETEHLVVVVAHDLDRGQRWPPGPQADVGLRQVETLVRYRFVHVGAIGAVASVVRLDQAGMTDVVAELEGAGVKRVHVLAGGKSVQCVRQRGVEAVPAGPDPAACLRRQRQRFAQHVGEGVALLGDTFGQRGRRVLWLSGGDDYVLACVAYGCMCPCRDGGRSEITGQFLASACARSVASGSTATGCRSFSSSGRSLSESL